VDGVDVTENNISDRAGIITFSRYIKKQNTVFIFNLF
jgi:hypothetical protein